MPEILEPADIVVPVRHHARVKITVPKKLRPEEKKLLQELAALQGGDK